jgi:hypothetical protein
MIIKQTPQSKAAAAAAAWEQQYAPYCSVDHWQAKMGAALKALGSQPTPEEVNALLGDNQWTKCLCTECWKSVDAVVRIGNEPDYESDTVWVCRECLAEAVRIMDEEGSEK